MITCNCGDRATLPGFVEEVAKGPNVCAARQNVDPLINQVFHNSQGPATLFGQFGRSEVTDVGVEDDGKLDSRHREGRSDLTR